MDNSRERDLYKLDSIRKDWNQPMSFRRGADRTMSKILKQMTDRTLVNLRTRLIYATKAHDLYEVWKLENLIRDHLKEEKFETRYFED